MTAAAPAAAPELERLAIERMANVLGPERARALYAKLGIPVSTAQDLMRLSQAMRRLGGFEAALGAMLGVAAVMRGAVDSPGP